MSKREVRAGQTIKLRARFKDDLDEVAEAGGVYVHLYEPDITSASDFVPANALVVSGAPSYLGEGIYELQYAVPNDGPDGIWHDQWEGILTGQTLSGLFQFEVSASGTISQLAGQLYQNNLVKITVTSGIMALDGEILAEDYEFDFLTTINPSYTNTRKVRLEIGSHIRNIEDDTIQTAILEASIEADILDFNATHINEDLFKHARRQYVTCTAATLLLDNNGGFMLRAKALDNLRVEYDTSGLQKTLDRIYECINKWEPQLLAGGGTKAIRSPMRVVKGDLDPDRPIVSRMWQSTEWGTVSRRMPVANDARRPSGHRRYLRTYRKKLW